MHKDFLKAGAAFGVLSVILGAFAEHAIKSKVSADVLAIFETGVRYQMYHTFALLITGILFKEFPDKSVIWAGRMFITGIILFSGSLYLLTFLKATANTGLPWAGILTPFGGVAFIAGWLLLLVSIFKKKG